MSDEPDQLPPTDDAALDRLLATAEWPTPDDGALRRLTRTVADQRRRRLRLRGPLAVAAAAAVAVVAGVCWVNRPGPTPPGALVDDHSQNTPATAPAPERVARADPPTASPAPAGRPPTLLEQQFALASARRRPTGPTAAAPRGERPPRDLARRDSGPRDAPLAVPPAAAVDYADAVRLARATFSGRHSDRPATANEVAVATQFAAVAGPGDWPLLRAALARPTLAAAVWPTVLARGDADGVDLLLTAVLDPQTRPAALAAVREGPVPPTDLLLDRLCGPLVDRRLAAAKVLGVTCDSRTLARLAEVARGGRSRGEALAVLLACDSPAARQWVERIGPDSALANQADAVRRQMDHLFL